MLYSSHAENTGSSPVGDASSSVSSISQSFQELMSPLGRIYPTRLPHTLGPHDPAIPTQARAGCRGVRRASMSALPSRAGVAQVIGVRLLLTLLGH